MLCRLRARIRRWLEPPADVELPEIRQWQARDWLRETRTDDWRRVGGWR